MKAIDVAYRVIKIAKDDTDLVNNLTPLKLQKLLFYIQAWYGANRGTRLFKEELHAWKYGPVVPEVYQLFRRYGSDDLTKIDIPEVNAIQPDAKVDDDIKSVLAVYGKMSPYELVTRTHTERVWRKNYESSNDLMPFEEIEQEFKLKLPKA